jgi:protein phosphatase PTC7
MIMVADGVGGWTKKDVDPGLFSKHMAKTVNQLYSASPSKSLKNLLLEAVGQNPHKGSSTALLAKLESGDSSGKMSTCELGDCSFMILRFDPEDRELVKVFRSTEM